MRIKKEKNRSLAQNGQKCPISGHETETIDVIAGQTTPRPCVLFFITESLRDTYWDIISLFNYVIYFWFSTNKLNVGEMTRVCASKLKVNLQ